MKLLKVIFIQAVRPHFRILSRPQSGSYSQKVTVANLHMGGMLTGEGKKKRRVNCAVLMKVRDSDNLSMRD